MTEQLTLIDKPDIKLIVIDVDNTLLNSQHKLSERNEQTIKAAIAQGTRVMLATGKTYGACKDLIERLGIKEPGIFTQGLTIHNANGTLRHQQILDTEIVRQVVTFAEDRGFAVALYAQGRLLARSKTPYLEELHEKWGDSKPEYMGPLQNILPTIEVNKVVALSAYDERKAKALRWQLNAQMDGRARLMNGGVPHMIEVLPPGASKGTALKSLLRELKIDSKNVMAIGDAENDVEMIQVAGVGVAVANAQQMLKDVADVMTGTHDEDGVAQVIEKYVTQTEMVAAQPESPPAETVEKPEDTAPDDIAIPPQAEALNPATPEKPEPAAPKPEDIAPQSSEE